jgi:hypothetical protein
MLNLKTAHIEGIGIHYVGNKHLDEGLILGDALVNLDDSITGLLQQYFTAPFREENFYTFQHSADLAMNEVYTFVGSIFENNESLHQNSCHIARHLYGQSDHPNIKAGELYVVYFSDCEVGDEIVDAVGIFKSENKETFLKVFPQGTNFEVQKEEGININKLDKGCLIFNMERDKGYRLLSVDKTNPRDEAQFWTNDFLNIQPREDNYHFTRNYMQMCREFAVEAFPEADRIDQVALMDESARYFKNEDIFDKADFEQKVLQEPEIIEAFEEYKDAYTTRKEVPLTDEFDINPSAVKKLKRVFKSVIKLDKNFHIYVHGNRNLIRKGHDDESGMDFYQLFFKEES